MTRRLMLVHAHPDDESILTGATIAHYLAVGADVAVVTCTRGEEGEIIPGALTHLDAAHDDVLGDYREGELAAALAALGGPEHYFLADGRWRDSGMAGTPSVARADCFWQADLLDATLPLVGLIRGFRPHVLVLEDPSGGYRHPDHVRSHQVGTYAAALAAAPTFDIEAGPGEHMPWSVSKVYWMAVPRSVLAAGLTDMAETLAAGDHAGIHCQLVVPGVDDLIRVVDDALVTTVVDGRGQLAAKRAAMAEHRTQITVATPGTFTLSNHLAQPLLGREYFRLAAGKPGPIGADGLETDLFAGLEDLVECNLDRVANGPTLRPSQTSTARPSADPGSA